ncbi:MAG TPA: twin-arginine translocase TatA/TatE family subunit [Miltoncostaeaceae bacterium]|nr:twin-arginine translocase TatA/TatE family subunit [Miltoncostaeaceae bacterium]
MFDISPIQIIIVLAIALLIFGPKRLPGMGRDLGRGIRDFKAGITGDDDRPVATQTYAPEHIPAEPQPTAEQLIAEAATPQPVREELDEARETTGAGTR